MFFFVRLLRRDPEDKRNTSETLKAPGRLPFAGGITKDKSPFHDVKCKL